jgi:hypothetical protein
VNEGKIDFLARNSWGDNTPLRVNLEEFKDWVISAPEFVWKASFSAFADIKNSKCSAKSNLFPVSAAVKYIVDQLDKSQVSQQIQELVDYGQSCEQ